MREENIYFEVDRQGRILAGSILKRYDTFMPHDPASSTQTIAPPSTWSLSPDESLDLFQSQREGLTQAEAQHRLQIYGQNLVRQKEGASRLKLIIEQCKTPLILILIVAACVTGFLREWLDTIVILAAVIVNAGLGFWQENKAQTILEHLASYIRVRARVRRDNQEREMDAADLVPGDIIRVSQGDRIPADARLLFANNLHVDESILTGESLPIEKHPNAVTATTPLAERTCMLYGGTLVVEGFGDALIVATDEHTEFGKIALLSAQKSPEPTPLQKAVARFSKQLGTALILVTLTIFGTGLWFGHAPVDMFLIAVAVAVSIVPEGLPIALTIILAVGVERLAKKQGIVRKLLAAEALGSTTLILTDKTGTLTQAKMTLTNILPWHDSTSAADLLAHAVLNTDVVIENPDDSPQDWRLVGRPMEVALVRDAAAHQVLLPKELKEVHILDRFPFHSRYKYSLTLIQDKHEQREVLIGAPEIILPFTTLSLEEQNRLRLQIEERAATGERLLGVAYKIRHTTHPTLHTTEQPINFIFEGLLAFRDPIRPHVKGAIARIGASGVRTIMITGDHPGTATTIGKDLGLFRNKTKALTGEDLRKLSPRSLASRAQSTSVYARVTPEQKLDIVRLYQSQGEIVAVTGDGVNDAPALEAADIGVAVGSGTDVAKSAADLIILDDNFETIVLAIEEGRRILGNIRKVLVYLLSNILDLTLFIGGALLLGLPLPLTPLQILFVNFFSDSFPAIAFAFEEENDARNQKRRQHLLFDNEMRILILVLGFSTSVLLFALYLFLLRAGHDPKIVHTFLFASFATYTLLMTFALRSLERSIFTYHPFGNPYLTGGVGIGILLTLSALYLPWLQRALDTVALPLPWLLAVFGVGIVNVCGVELVKWLVRKRIITD